MSAKIITAIAFKLLAIWLALQILLSLPALWQVYDMYQIWGPNNPSLPPQYLVLAIFAFIVIAAIAARAIYRLADSALSSMPSQSSEMPSRQLEQQLVQILGVYFIVISAAQIPNDISWLYVEINRQPNMSSATIFTPILRSMITLLSGLALAVKPAAWKNLLDGMKTAGGNR